MIASVMAPPVIVIVPVFTPRMSTCTTLAVTVSDVVMSEAGQSSRSCRFVQPAGALSAAGVKTTGPPAAPPTTVIAIVEKAGAGRAVSVAARRQEVVGRRDVLGGGGPGAERRPPAARGGRGGAVRCLPAVRAQHFTGTFAPGGTQRVVFLGFRLSVSLNARPIALGDVTRTTRTVPIDSARSPKKPRSERRASGARRSTGCAS